MADIKFRRVFLIVLDSVGIGEAPDAIDFGDKGSHTLGHIATYVDGLAMPNMERLGLGNIEPIHGISKVTTPQAHYGKMAQASKGKDTLTGHWELMGLALEERIQTYPKGFDKELITMLEQEIGRKVIGNKVASGTAIIEELGGQHMKTGHIIVYTSADSVLQIAAHEKVIPLQELYEICKIARRLTKSKEHLVGRVIARPFIGEEGHFRRTANRRDYALEPFGRTVLDELKDANYAVFGIGKINDIFAGSGITTAINTRSNEDGVNKLLQNMKSQFTGLSFLNLVDFDSLFGHRRDPVGYARALEQFDKRLPEIVAKIEHDDLLILTADHGNDPTFSGSDHTREYVPLLVYHRTITRGFSLGIRKTFSDVGATIADNFHVPFPKNGVSFLDAL